MLYSSGMQEWFIVSNDQNIISRNADYVDEQMTMDSNTRQSFYVLPHAAHKTPDTSVCQCGYTLHHMLVRALILSRLDYCNTITISVILHEEVCWLFFKTRQQPVRRMHPVNVVCSVSRIVMADTDYCVMSKPIASAITLAAGVQPSPSYVCWCMMYITAKLPAI